MILVEKKKIYDTETLSNDRTLNKEPFYEKIMQKMFNNFAPKASLRPLFNVDKYPNQSLHERNCFKKIIF